MRSDARRDHGLLLSARANIVSVTQAHGEMRVLAATASLNAQP